MLSSGQDEQTFFADTHYVTHNEYQKVLSFYQLPQKFLLFPTHLSSAVVQDITPLYKSVTSCNCNYQHNVTQGPPLWQRCKLMPTTHVELN